jgi:riboflavin kinase/FMN adenylyltransferase
LVAQAQHDRRLAGVVTFDPHPAAVLHPERPALYLSTPAEKSQLLEQLGVDWLAIVPFGAALAATSPQAFMEHLYRGLNMRCLWVGTDFALGRDRQGDIGTLRLLGRKMGFDVEEVHPVTIDGRRVSSTSIRILLQHGHVKEAAHLLARYYSVSGTVAHGAKRGRDLGFPTANVDVPTDRVVPADGIYAAYARLENERCRAVVNIGVRPTFDNGARSVEAYLLDFERDLYGHQLGLEFVARLRPERRFQNVQDLIAQMRQDVEQTRRILDAIDREPPWQQTLPTLGVREPAAQ